MEEFRICTSCGYGRGFHVFFRAAQKGHRIGLICPGCGQSYDIGWVSQDIEGSRPQATEVFEGR